MMYKKCDFYKVTHTEKIEDVSSNLIVLQSKKFNFYTKGNYFYTPKKINASELVKLMHLDNIQSKKFYHNSYTMKYDTQFDIHVFSYKVRDIVQIDSLKKQYVYGVRSWEKDHTDSTDFFWHKVKNKNPIFSSNGFDLYYKELIISKEKNSIEVLFIKDNFIHRFLIVANTAIPANGQYPQYDIYRIAKFFKIGNDINWIELIEQ